MISCSCSRLGALAIGAVIEAGLARGARDFDFLRGAEPYKYEWGAADTRNATRSVRLAP
jgi:CelD/BcsL family acetyltransferase involved in cellulose biosynthesis